MTDETIIHRFSTMERAARDFQQHTTKHQVTILHDDGLYRHVQFAHPDTYAHSFSLVTWPGYLTIYGDVGTYTFARIRDMFDFFTGDNRTGISPDYWAEKIQAGVGDGSGTAYRYCVERYTQLVTEWCDQQIEARFDPDHEDGIREFKAAVERELLQQQPYSEEEARDRLRNFEYFHIDSWEWSLHDLTFHYLWCCYAIVWGIRRYREAKGDTRAGS